MLETDRRSNCTICTMESCNGIHHQRTSMYCQYNHSETDMFHPVRRQRLNEWTNERFSFVLIVQSLPVGISEIDESKKINENISRDIDSFIFEKSRQRKECKNVHGSKCHLVLYENNRRLRSIWSRKKKERKRDHRTIFVTSVSIDRKRILLLVTVFWIKIWWVVCYFFITQDIVYCSLILKKNVT